MSSKVYVRISTRRKTSDTTSDPETLYLTTGTYAYRDADPTTNAAPVEWRPVIQQIPTVQQSNTEFITSNISVSNTSLTLINNGELNDLISGDIGWYNSEAVIWFEVEGAITKVFTGVVGQATVSDRTINISIKSNIEKLKQPAYFGDTEDECYIRTATYPNAQPNDIGNSVPLCIGPFFAADIADQEFVFTSTGGKYEAQLMGSGGLEGRLVDTDEYLLGRVPAEPTITSINLSVTDITPAADQTEWRRTLSAASVDAIKHGDVLEIRLANNDLVFGYVFYIDYSRGIFRVTNTTLKNIGLEVGWAASDVITITQRFDTDFYSYNNTLVTNFKTDVTLESEPSQFSATTGGNFKAINFPGFSLQFHEKFYLGHYGEPFSHEDTIDRLFLNTGITLIKSNISEVSGVRTMASYPKDFTTPIPAVLDVLQDLSTGLGAIVGVQNGGDILYKLLSNTLTPTRTITETEQLRGSLRIKDEYRDLAKVLSLTNSIAERVRGPSSAFANVTTNSVETLYGVTRSTSVTHPHENTAAFVDRTVALTTQPKRLYTLQVPVEYMDIELGDEVQLTLPSFGIDEACYVVGYAKSINNIELTLLRPFQF